MHRRLPLLALLGLVGPVHPSDAQERPIPTLDDDLPTCETAEALEGVVVDGATRVPIAEASVFVSIAGETRSTTTTAAGRFRLCDIPPGAMVLAGAEHAGVRSPVRAIPGDNGGEPFVVALDLGTPASIIVTATDTESGEPVEGVTIRLLPGLISAVTNRAGRAGLGLVPPGDYRLRADHIGFDSFDEAVFVVPSEPRQLDLALRPRAIALDPLEVEIEAGLCAKPGFTSLSGRVVDRRTKIPIPEARVTASRFAGDDGFVGQQAETDDDGGFVVCGMPVDQRIRLQARAGRRNSDTKFITATPGGDAIVLEVDNGEPGFIVLYVTDASTGAPVEGAMIRLNPLPLGGITSDNGRAGFREVPPGEYEVRVDHLAYASFDGVLNVERLAAEEFEIPLQPTAIAMEPLEVRITGRDPYLLGLGFYDRMADPEVEGEFYDYWDFESYATLGALTQYKTFVNVDILIPFVNGRPAARTGYESVNEIPFGQIRGVEFIRCLDLPPELSRWLDDFHVIAASQGAGWLNCVAQLIWRGERRVRAERDPPTDRCERERRADLLCRQARADSLAAGGGGSGG
ncbi:MAG: carboxypeptidase regulatory-like domain-containing protein [Gemmatimonadota bacterium]|nr:carboxypeptidase regulatory-like domain-containing protein [Gemmatimonadota bacterium]